MKKGQATLDGEGQIILSKTGKAICRKCGHYLRRAWWFGYHPDENGLFKSTVWCTCDCYKKFDSHGRPKKLTPLEKFRLELYRKWGW
jgi:hypothetical protein